MQNSICKITQFYTTPKNHVTFSTILQIEFLTISKMHLIAKGVFGTVFRCGFVAVKQIESRHIISATKEIMALLICKHPNVLRIYHFAIINEIVSLYSELCDDNLRNILRRGINNKTAEKYICELATAVCHVHQMGLIHGDLKPENILVRNDQIILADFGLSCFASEDLHLSPIHTIYYRAPEIAEKGRCKFQQNVDIFAFGCVVYEIIKARRLRFGQSINNIVSFREQTGFDDFTKVSHDQVVTWLQFHALSHNYAKWVARCLHPDPCQRWTFIELANHFGIEFDKKAKSVVPLESATHLEQWLFEKTKNAQVSADLASILFSGNDQIVKECSFEQLVDALQHLARICFCVKS